MRRLSATTIALLFVTGLAWSPLQAQRSADSTANSLGWSTRIVDADRSSEARSFRIYGTPDQLTLALVVANRSARSVTLTQQMFSSHVRVSVVGADAVVPVTVTWLPEALGIGGALDPRLVLPTEPVQVDVRRTVEWRVVLRPIDTAGFAAREYAVKIDFSDEMAARSAMHATQLTVFASPARNDDERASEYHFLGRKALVEGRFVEARGYLQSARAVKPSGSVGLVELAITHLWLKEYRRAIIVLEQLPPSHGHSAVPQTLALAYLGVGDDYKAAQVLRRAGMSSPDVVSELDRLRRRVRP